MVQLIRDLIDVCETRPKLHTSCLEKQAKVFSLVNGPFFDRHVLYMTVYIFNQY